MILKRYGSTIQSVEPHFESRALTEVGFRRDRAFSMPADEFERTYRLEDVRELAAEAEAAVQIEAEQAALERLAALLEEARSQLAEGEVLLVESEQGKDYPKLRERTEGVIVEGENRLRFHRWIEPPLRVGIYRRDG